MPDKIVSAKLNGSVIGLGAIKYGGVNPVDYRLWRLLRCLSPGIIRFLVVGLIFVLTAERRNELYLEMLAVDSEYRGMGVGGELMRIVLDFARSGGFGAVNLHVIDTNLGARRFYGAFGFEERGYTRIFPWEKIFGFRGVYELFHRV